MVDQRGYKLAVLIQYTKIFKGAELCNEKLKMPSKLNPSCKVKVKVKRFRYRPGVAQRMGRGIAVLFHDRGTRRG